MPFPILFGTTVTTVLHYRADCDVSQKRRMFHTLLVFSALQLSGPGRSEYLGDVCQENDVSELCDALTQSTSVCQTD